MALAKALGSNKSLLYLNLSNNMLEETIGTEFVKYTDINRDLICFEFAFNQFILIQVQEIIKNIKRNKAAYDALRLWEWREWKRMATEEELMRKHVIEEQKKEITEEEAEKSRILRERAKDDLWK